MTTTFALALLLERELFNASDTPRHASGCATPPGLLTPAESID
jgi:hypothetical protein